MSLSCPLVLRIGPEFVFEMFSRTSDEDPFTITPQSSQEESIMLRDPVVPSPPASTQMPTPLQLICCKVRVKTCCIRMPVETLMKLDRCCQYIILSIPCDKENSPHVPDRILLIAKQNANIASNKAQVAHEQSRTAARVSAIHLDANMLASFRHLKVHIDQVGSLGDRPIQAIDFLVGWDGRCVDLYISDPDVEVGRAWLAVIVAVHDY